VLIGDQTGLVQADERGHRQIDDAAGRGELRAVGHRDGRRVSRLHPPFDGGPVAVLDDGRRLEPDVVEAGEHRGLGIVDGRAPMVRRREERVHLHRVRREAPSEGSDVAGVERLLDPAHDLRCCAHGSSSS
jgi:hypothetical protein